MQTIGPLYGEEFIPFTLELFLVKHYHQYFFAIELLILSFNLKDSSFTEDLNPAFQAIELLGLSVDLNLRKWA